MTPHQRRQLFLTTAIEGWRAPEGTPSPYLTTSQMDTAWRLGRWLQSTGRSAPRDVRPSRGDKWHCNGMLLKVTGWSSGDGLQIERVE